jgi:hypothetical protein
VGVEPNHEKLASFIEVLHGRIAIIKPGQYEQADLQEVYAYITRLRRLEPVEKEFLRYLVDQSVSVGDSFRWEEPVKRVKSLKYEYLTNILGENHARTLAAGKEAGTRRNSRTSAELPRTTLPFHSRQ